MLLVVPRVRFALWLTLVGCERWGYQPHFGAPVSRLTFADARVRDTYVDSRPNVSGVDQHPLNFGRRDNLYASTYATSLVRFDLSAMPRQATVVAASLSLFVTETSVGWFALHRILEEWNEGTGTAGSPTLDAANWNERWPSTPWATPGCGEPGSRDADIVAEFRLDELGELAVDVDVDIVQRWIDGTWENFGFAMTGSSGDGASPSSNDGPSGQGPVLEVRYIQE